MKYRAFKKCTKDYDEKFTREKVDELFKKYITILTGKEIDIDYRSVENGG